MSASLQAAVEALADEWVAADELRAVLAAHPTADQQPPADQIGELAEQIVADRMAHYGYTGAQIAAAEIATHETAGCVNEHPYGWICTDENDKSLHPDRDELERTAEFVMWVLEHPAIAAALGGESA